jgi:hypothetical protein
METAPREWSRLPLTADRAVGERSAAAGDRRRRERGIYARSAADHDSEASSVKVSQSDLEDETFPPRVDGFSVAGAAPSGRGRQASPDFPRIPTHRHLDDQGRDLARRTLKMPVLECTFGFGQRITNVSS